MRPVNRLLRNLTVLLALACPDISRTLHAQSVPGIPEPGLIMYGRVLDRQSGQAVEVNAVAFQITGNAETANLAANAVNFVTLNDQVFYVSQVPFETRLADGQSLPKKPNTLALTTENTPYKRAVTVNGRTASFKTPGTDQFLFGATERGRIERLDLEVEGVPVIVPEPGNELRIQADLKPALQNGTFFGITFEWASKPGKTYSIHRTSDLSAQFERIGSVTAKLSTVRFTDAEATGSGPFFYRLAIDP